MIQLKPSIPTALLLALALLLNYTPCSSAQTRYQITADQSQQSTSYFNSRRRWEQMAITNYVYVYQKQCDVCCWINNCAMNNYPWRVQVNNDLPVTNAIDNKQFAVNGGLTVFQLFDQINAALQNPNQLVDATYDPTFGHPTRYNIQTGPWPNPSAFDSTSIGPFQTLPASQASMFATARDLWARQRRTTYQYTYVDRGPNPLNILYPVRVQVTNGVVTQAFDGNNNEMSFNRVPIPKTIDQYMDEISRQISSRAPYIENTYDRVQGYPATILMVSVTGNWDIQITSLL